MLSPVKLLRMSKQEAYDNAYMLLKEVGLSEKADSYPDELSGGQKQRIAIVRTLAMDPDVILMDEPTSALDPTMVGEVLAVIRMLAKRDMTMIIVTHEMNFARDVATKVLFLADGGIYEEGSPSEIFDNPKREKTRRFVHRLKVLELNIESRDYDFIGMVGKIENWCSKNQINSKLTNRIRLVFEEATQLLIPHYKTPLVKLVCEYSEQSGVAKWTFSYAGKSIDVTKSEDNLGVSVLKGLAAKISYSREENEPLPNILSVEIK